MLLLLTNILDWKTVKWQENAYYSRRNKLLHRVLAVEYIDQIRGKLRTRIHVYVFPSICLSLFLHVFLCTLKNWYFAVCSDKITICYTFIVRKLLKIVYLYKHDGIGLTFLFDVLLVSYPVCMVSFCSSKQGRGGNH